MTSTISPGTAAGSSASSDVVVTEAIAGIYRVEKRGRIVGYVQETGQRWVSLLGAVYNTSVEVSQTLTLDAAVNRLLAA